jgi:hypothetical protein
MTLGVSLLLVATGAILIWGVTGEASGIDVDAIGVILIVVGIIGFILSLVFWDRWGAGMPWGGARRVRYVEGAPVQRTVAAPARTTVVEEEVEEYPAGPPPGAPPPP